MRVCFYEYLKLQVMYKCDTRDTLPLQCLPRNKILSAVKISSKFDSTIDFQSSRKLNDK